VCKYSPRNGKIIDVSEELLAFSLRVDSEEGGGKFF
jgi:hypothetical protein